METKSTKIEWHAGKSLFKAEVKGRKRQAQAMLDSFFSWFESSSDMLSDEVGELIKDDVWNNPMQYYLSSEMDDDEEDIEEEEEEEDEDEENIE